MFSEKIVTFALAERSRGVQWHRLLLITLSLILAMVVGNCLQAVMGNLDIYRRFIDEGGAMHLIALDDASTSHVAALAAGGCIAIAHHGETTDRLFKAGKLDEVREYLKKVRDAGVQVGVSTHMPDVVDAIESAGWDIDFYMTCVYERHRTAAELEKLLGHVQIGRAHV